MEGMDDECCGRLVGGELGPNLGLEVALAQVQLINGLAPELDKLLKAMTVVAVAAKLG